MLACEPGTPRLLIHPLPHRGARHVTSSQSGRVLARLAHTIISAAAAFFSLAMLLKLFVFLLLL